MTALTLQTATAISQQALAAGRAITSAPLTIAVLDAGGHLITLLREDGASMLRPQIAIGKAWGAVGMGVSSRVLAQRAKDNPNFFTTLSATSQGKFLPQPGAVLILDAHGKIMGAAGASGGTGDEDEAICMAGVQAAGFKAG